MSSEVKGEAEPYALAVILQVGDVRVLASGEEHQVLQLDLCRLDLVHERRVPILAMRVRHCSRT